MNLVTDITSANWQLSASSFGSVVESGDDINQSIGIILMSLKGSDPFRPTFGSDIWDYVDKPIGSAAPGIVNAITNDVAIWEPRIKLTEVSYVLTKQGVDGEGMLDVVEFTIKWESASGTGADQVVLLFTPASDTVPFTVDVLATEDGEGVTSEDDDLIIV